MPWLRLVFELIDFLLTEVIVVAASVSMSRPFPLSSRKKPRVAIDFYFILFLEQNTWTYKKINLKARLDSSNSNSNSIYLV